MKLRHIKRRAVRHPRRVSGLVLLAEAQRRAGARWFRYVPADLARDLRECGISTIETFGGVHTTPLLRGEVGKVDDGFRFVAAATAAKGKA